MGGFFWIVVTSKVDLRKANPKTMELTSMCASCVVASTKLGVRGGYPCEG
jgi:hypothetical protein